jgi:hypothetical protein
MPALRGSVPGIVDLHEHVEHPRDHLLRDADAVVDDAHGYRIARCSTLIWMLRRCVLRGVVQQVGEHLREPDGVCVERDFLGRIVLSLCCCESMIGTLVSMA